MWWLIRILHQHQQQTSRHHKLVQKDKLCIKHKNRRRNSSPLIEEGINIIDVENK